MSTFATRQRWKHTIWHKYFFDVTIRDVRTGRFAEKIESHGVSTRVRENRFEKSKRLRPGNFPGVHGAKAACACHVQRKMYRTCRQCRSFYERHWRNKRTGADDWPITQWPRYLPWYWLNIDLSATAAVKRVGTSHLPNPFPPSLYPIVVPPFPLFSDVRITQSYFLVLTLSPSLVLDRLTVCVRATLPLFLVSLHDEIGFIALFSPLRTASISRLLVESVVLQGNNGASSNVGGPTHLEALNTAWSENPENTDYLVIVISAQLLLQNGDIFAWWSCITNLGMLGNVYGVRFGHLLSLLLIIRGKRIEWPIYTNSIVG